MNIKVLVIVLLIALVVCAIAAFLIYLKKTKEETSEHMPTPNKSLIKVRDRFFIKEYMKANKKEDSNM